MEEISNDLQDEKIEIETSIKELSKKKKDIEKTIRNNKAQEKRRSRPTYSNGGNKLIRVSNAFSQVLEKIDSKREDLDLGKISHPKKTDLIIRHKDWKTKEEDIINYDTSPEENQYDE